MRVLVTGTGGAFAHALLPALCARGEIEGITAVDVTAAGHADPKVTDSLQDVAALAGSGMLRGHDALVYVPASNPGSPARRNPETTAHVAHKLFLAAHAAGVRRLVHVSTAAVYGAAVHASEQAPLRPLAGFAYAEEQAHLERLLAIDLPECVRLRPHLVVGPHAHRAVRLLLRQPFYVRGAPHARFQCVHEDDLAQAVVLAITAHARGAYNLATEGNFSLREALRARRALAIGLSAAAARHAFTWGTKLLALELEPAWLERASHTLLVNCRRAVSELGWRRRFEAPEALAAS